MFTTNILFDLNIKKEFIGPYGSLIGIPHRHVVIIYPIKTLEVVEAINRLIPIIFGMEREGPGSISNLLYWFKDNEYTTLPYKISEDKMDFYPPQTFVDVLNQLK